ncbi:MAG: M23 family metallopeptidase [Nannocystaceae bacterium]|nr:M23 family metallopeptidase [Nannocystaceae bacterium]
MSRSYRSPVPGAQLPRRHTKRGGGDFLNDRGGGHIHQGIDIGARHDPSTSPYDNSGHNVARLAGKLDIVSVTDGVIKGVVRTDSGTSYGRRIVIYNEEMDLWFLYAHCQAFDRRIAVGKRVYEGRVIAQVGWSGNAGKGNPHLHFEMGTRRIPPFDGKETTTTHQGARIDPRPVLEGLGPFLAKQTYFVVGGQVNTTTSLDKHKLVEESSSGGFFPLGANNFWHGGVHLPYSPGSDLIAPFDGEIVAVRLDPDPATAMREYGSTNFVLMRHQLAESVYARMQGGAESPDTPGSADTPKPRKERKSGVGGRFDNAPALVVEAKRRLRALAYYAAPVPPAPDLVDDGETIEQALVDAIMAFQMTLARPRRARTWPDGSMGHGGYTWAALFEDDDSHDDGDDDDDHSGDEEDDDDDDEPPAPAPKPTHPERVVYSLLMHVGAVPINDGLAVKVPWLSAVRATSGPGPVPPGVREAKERARRHQEDVDEAAEHRITTSVGTGVGDHEDILWVCKRLIRFEFLSGSPSEVADVELGRAVEAFQIAHVYPHKPARADGVVSRKGRTVRRLRKTRRNLGLDPGPGGVKMIDPLFLALANERGADGMTRVVSGLGVRVRAGEVLWPSGAAASFSEVGLRQLRNQVHWEVFSAEKTFGDKQEGWDSIVDPDEDLTVDAPRALVALVEAGTFRGTPPFSDTPEGVVPLAELMTFYRSSHADVLRRRQCKFRTEWGLDIDTTIERLSKLGSWFDVDRLRTDLLPYQWWEDAASVLPKDDSSSTQTHVWHYNPIEFVAAYQAIIAGLQPSARKDTELFSDVVVRVLNRHGAALGMATIELRGQGEPPRTETTTAPSRGGVGGGEGEFLDVPKGGCTIIVSFADKYQAWASGPLEFTVVAPLNVNMFTIETPLDGPLPATGSVRVSVRQRGSQYREPVAIEVADKAGVVVFSGDSDRGTLVVEALRFGEYTIRSADDESDPVSVEIRAKRQYNRMLHRYLSKAPLHVAVTFEGAPAADVAVVAYHKTKDAPATNGAGRTGVDGRCVLDVREGWYTVRAGKVKARAHAIGGRTELVELVLKEAPPEPEATGLLLVRVRFTSATNSEVPTGEVQLSSSGNPAIVDKTARLDSRGDASFTAYPGPYVVRYKSVEATVTVTAGSTAAATLEP